MSIFGRILSEDQVEEAVIGTLRDWLPVELSEVERQRGLEAGYYDRPVDSSYTARSDFDKWPEEFLPLVVVISPGLDDDPVKDGENKLRGKFQIGVVSVVTSVDRLETRRYAYRMGAAVRATLAHHQSLDLALGGTVRGVDLVGGRNNELPTSDDRTIWASRQLFVVEVADILTVGAGPVVGTDVPDDPTAPWPDPPTINSPQVVLEPTT